MAWKHLELATTSKDPTGWLVAVARNILRNLRRGHKRRTALDYKAAQLRVPAPMGPGELAMSSHGVARIHAVFLNLSELDQQIVGLVALNGLSAEDVARLIGESGGFVRIRLYRARQQMKEELARENPNGWP